MVRGCDGRYSGCRYKGCSTRREGERGMRRRRRQRDDGGNREALETGGKRGRHRCGETERERESERGIEGRG